VSRVVHVPYSISQDEDGVWCASAQLTPGPTLTGQPPTCSPTFSSIPRRASRRMNPGWKGS